MLCRWIVYYAFGVGWLVLIVAVAVGRVRSSPLGAPGELLLGGIVVGGGLLAFAVFLVLWIRPAAQARAAFRAMDQPAFAEIAPT